MADGFRQFIEGRVFGVCTWLGDRVGIPSTTIRKYFIYISCLTMGSPVIIYLFMAFWINLKEYIWKAKRNPLRYY
jgi:phage shock protein PspC (stress-responsive transcriptional regulator)